MQEEGEEVHCNLGKTWKDLLEKEGKERKGECRKKGKRYTVTWAKLGKICLRSKGKKERVSAGRRGRGTLLGQNLERFV